MEKPHYLNHRERLRARFSGSGFSGMADYEALELLLTYAIARRDVKPLAKQLIKRFGGFRQVLDATPQELLEIKGINERTAVFIGAIRESAQKYTRGKLKGGPQISSTSALLDYCTAALAGLKDERFMALFLNSSNEVIADEVINEGTVNQSAVYPRKVMERALYHKAVALIFVHNHPGGTCRPSPQDIKLTRELCRIAGDLQIAVHDHLIICRDGYFSFLEKGML